MLFGGADRSPVRERKAQMRDARFEVVLQAGHRRRQRRAIGRHNVVAQQAGERRRGTVSGRFGGYLSYESPRACLGLRA